MVEPAISFRKVDFTYSADTAFAYQALQQVSFDIAEGSFTALIGHTGSGKSTIAKLIDGLQLPSQGQVQVAGMTLSKQIKHEELAQLHKRVGLVFQFPEKQLFADTVMQDVMFGPLNLGLTETEAKQRAQDALDRVQIDQDLNDQSPFELSGGQKRRIAIAGVLAMQPQILILDEPTAGLDPEGQRSLLQLVADLHHEGRTILMITHQMERVAQYCDDALVVKQGQLIYHGGVAGLFSDPALLKQANLEQPRPLAFANRLVSVGWHFDHQPRSTEDLAAMLAQQLKEMPHE